MLKKKINKGLGIGGAVVAVLATGVLIGILFAPHRGKRTRKDLLIKGEYLLNKAHEAIDTGKDNLELLKDKLENHLQQVKDKISHLNA